MLKDACSACRAELAAYLDNELGRKKALRTAGHLAGCAACRRELDLLRDCLEKAQAWQPVEPSAEFERRFWSRLACLRRETEAAHLERPGLAARFLHSLRPRFALAATAVCAALVVLAGAVGLRQDRALSPDTISIARDMDLFMHLDIIQNSEALEYFELISLLDVLGQEFEE